MIAKSALCEIIHESPVDVVATVGDCLMMISLSALSPRSVLGVSRAFSNLTQRYGSVNFFAFIAAGKPDYPPQSQSGLAQVVRKYTRSITGAALVCEGSGFRVTATRSIITAVHLASFAAHPLKVFSEVDPALAWLQEKQREGHLDVAALAEQIRISRARLG